MARVPGDSVLRPGMKVCAMQSRAARGRRGPGGGGRARGAAARVSTVPRALAAQVPPRSQWPPRSRSLRPAPCALRAPTPVPPPPPHPAPPPPPPRVRPLHFLFL